MNGEARKLHLIEALLKEDDEQVLSGIENLLTRNEMLPVEKKGFMDLAGTLSDEEADEMIRVINEGCRQINPDDWK